MTHKKKLIREGAPHAHQQAAKILKSQGLDDVQKQPEVVEQVRGIFPQVEQQMPRTPPNAKLVDIGDTLERQMLKQLRGMRGKAPGPNGWTADALCQLVDDLEMFILFWIFVFFGKIFDLFVWTWDFLCGASALSGHRML
jgi:hypothetical protein